MLLPSGLSFSSRCPHTPRIPGRQVVGHAYYGFNRSTIGAPAIHKNGDYAGLLDLLATANARQLIKIFGFCVIPN
jgi:hypothetical protein